MSSFLTFNQMLTDCDMLEFPKRGNIWSWRGIRNTGIVRCILDKAYGNGKWFEQFPKTETHYLDMIGSDHRPILVRAEETTVKSQEKRFHFDKRWLGKTGFQEIVERSWAIAGQGYNGQRRECSIIEKIRLCRKEISHWRSQNLPSGRQTITYWKQQVEDLNNTPIVDSMALNEAISNLKTAYYEEEVYWKQKSRNKWLREGDNNTKFFHAIVRQRRARNQINGLIDRHGKWVEKDSGIIHEASWYFTDLFTSNGNDEVNLEEIHSQVTDLNNRILIRPATEDEVKRALFDMDPDKAPGPDGMTALFFQHSWEIVKGDLLSLVNNFLREGEFHKDLNKTNICLIPKVNCPTRMTEFRPISLCNIGYKLIAKVLCLRLKILLPAIVSETQSAFVAGRLITDNILIAQEMIHALATTSSVSGQYMAIKTDMSKAYDRVEWNFLRAIMLKLGFGTQWIKCVMWCITSVEYSVLLNGTPCGHITPGRGLRQGDPLSPYLSILCTEVLIAKLKRAEQNKIITGIKIGRSCQPISHLLFADDTVFFCRATTEEAGKIRHILGDYEKMSGQRINFDKSSIQFGKRVDSEIRTQIQQILAIPNTGGMGLYLGLPENLSGSKAKVFAYIVERLKARVASWSSNLLSKAGKEILIKSILTALPTYIMSCYRLSKSVLGNIQSAIAHFWWASSRTNSGIHWKKWEELCKPKTVDGLGFRQLEDFNSALLAKQIWRLLVFPESLLARVLKGKYYKDDSLVAVPLRPGASYGWKSILSGRPLLLQGLIRKIGDGRNIKIWQDSWIRDIEPRPARGSNLVIFPDMTVDQFIDRHSGRWKEVLVRQYFDPRDVRIILAIRLPQCPRSDFWGWHHTTSGKYSVKSGYELARAGKVENQHLVEPTFDTLYNKCWKLDCSPKIKHVIWQMLSGCIAVCQNLVRWKLGNDARCQRCGAESETINHVIFDCPPAVQVWALSAIPSQPGVFPGMSAWYNLDYLLTKISESGDNSMSPWLIWHIWKARNSFYFTQVDLDPRTVLVRAQSDFSDWIETHQDVRRNWMQYRPRTNSNKSSIIFPTTANLSFTGYKCYVDASWKDTGLFSGLGWFCFPDSVEGIYSGFRRIHHSLSALHAEVEAVIWAMEALLELQIQEVEISSDCETAYQVFQNPEEWPEFYPYQEDFRRLAARFSFCSLSVIPRALNYRADALTKSADGVMIISKVSVANEIEREIKTEVSRMEKSIGAVPGLAVIQVGKVRFFPVYCRMLGMKRFAVNLAKDSSEEEVLKSISRFNDDPCVHGIHVLSPSPMDKQKIMNAISIEKDVDGFHPQNLGRLAIQEIEPFNVPLEPKACMELIRRYNLETNGKRAVVLGSSYLFSMPVAQLLEREGATVTIIHSKTKNPEEITRQADIIISDIGDQNRGSWIKPGAVVIDFGPTSLRYRDYKVASAITLDNGIGSSFLIAMMCLSNVLASAKRFHNFI